MAETQKKREESSVHIVTVVNNARNESQADKISEHMRLSTPPTDGNEDYKQGGTNGRDLNGSSKKNELEGNDS